MFLDEPGDRWVREMLLSAYRLLVNMIAADPAPSPDRLRLLLQVLYAIRTPHAVAMLAGGTTAPTTRRASASTSCSHGGPV